MPRYARFASLLLVVSLLLGCLTPAVLTPTTIPPAATLPPADTAAPPPTLAPSEVPAATAAPSEPPAATAITGGGKKPNIVFILADDLDAAEFQFMPNLQKLIADQGMTFTNYSVAMSLCCPSRATTLRGQYPHNTQILGNSPPTGGFEKFFQLGEEKSTIAVWLQNAGYHTMLAGKYLNGYPLKTDPFYIPPGWNEWYSAMKGNPYSEYNYSLNENGKQVDYGKAPKDYGTDVYVGKAIDFIQRTAPTGAPFFIYLAPYAPHAPYTPAPRHADLFPGVTAPRTPNYDEADVTGKPAYIADRPPLSAKQIKQIDEAYRKRLQALQAVDEGIAAIVKALQDAGQLDNTYIFFTSDNGYHLGNHRQVLGKIAPYQEELRVTMRVRGPGVTVGGTNDFLTGNVDLAPTFADLAGAAVPDFVDGRSLAPLMRANPPSRDQWRQSFGIENGPEKLSDLPDVEPTPNTDASLLEPNDQDQTDLATAAPQKKKKGAVPPLRGVRLQTLSYVEYATGEVELYDLAADPYELHNLAPTADPKLLSALAALVKQLAACKGAQCRAVEDTPFKAP